MTRSGAALALALVVVLFAITLILGLMFVGERIVDLARYLEQLAGPR